MESLAKSREEQTAGILDDTASGKVSKSEQVIKV